MVPAGLTVRVMRVDAVSDPELPVMVIGKFPVVAELLAASVRRLLPVAGLVPKVAVTPLGNPDADRFTLPVNPPRSVTLMVSVVLLPCVTDALPVVGASVKLGVDPVTVTVKACVLLHDAALVYVATYVLTPVLKAMLLIWRVVEVNPLGPVQLQVPVRGCGPRYTTVAVELTVAVDSSVQVEPPFTEMNGTIGVCVQLPVTINVNVVDELNVPEVPVMVTV